MDFAEWMKAFTRPAIALLLVVGWIIMICEGIEVPALYEAATVGANAWWGFDRSLKHKEERKAEKEIDKEHVDQK